MKNVAEMLLKLNPLSWIVKFGVFIIGVILWFFGNKKANDIKNNRRIILDEHISNMYNKESNLNTKCNEEIISDNYYKEYKGIIEKIGRKNNDDIYVSRKCSILKHIKIKFKGFYLYIDATVDFLIDKIFLKKISLENRKMFKISIFFMVLGGALSFDTISMIKELLMYIFGFISYIIINFPQVIKFIWALIVKFIEFEIVSKFIILFNVVVGIIKLIGVALFIIAIFKCFLKK